MPFIFGFGIRLVFEDLIRYGERLVLMDNNMMELYQTCFKEFTGFRISPFSVLDFLSKFSLKDTEESIEKTLTRKFRRRTSINLGSGAPRLSYSKVTANLKNS